MNTILKALVVGIKNYPKRPLKYSVKDAIAVHELLSRNEDGKPNFDAKLVKNVKTLAKLKGHLFDLFNERAETVLFYFAGHGMYDNFGFHLVTPDGYQNDWGLSMSDLLILANNSKAKNKVIILDCCFAGGIDENNGMPSYLCEGLTIMAAARKNQKAYETNGHGVFTRLLIEALKGGACDLNGKISPGSLYAYIDNAMGENEQRPMFKTNVSQFVSLRQVSPPIAPDVLASIVDFFPDPEKVHKLNPSYEFTNDPAYEPMLRKPYKDNTNADIFGALQKMTRVGLVVPVGEEHMYFAAMNRKSCRLTPLGKHYWELVKKAKAENIKGMNISKNTIVH